ncbi:MAG: aminotransferase-like domain-containing protein [Planctomycetaceae bacterium]
MPQLSEPEWPRKAAIPLSLRWQWGSRQPISFLMEQAVQNPDVIAFSAGLVDQTSLPASPVKDAAAALFADEPRLRQALQYGTTPGAERLRQRLLEHLTELEKTSVADLGIDAGQVLLTTGSQQLLSLVGEVLVDPGDIVFVAAPTYFVFLGTLNGLGARVQTVATDDEGMRLDLLEAELARLERAGELSKVKLIYVVSYYDNPTGRSLSLERRSALVGLAQRWSKQRRILVLEDAAYRELRYDGDLLPSVWGCDGARDTVILAQTFSKSFSPGLRVGYGVVPRDLVAPLCDRKGNEDFGSANFNQHLLASVLERGLYGPHVTNLCQTYRAKRDCMLEAAQRHMRDLGGVEWVHPHGGLYVWMTVPAGLDTGFDGPLFRQATREEGVMYVPGDVCYGGPAELRPRNQMRLSFGTESHERIDEGLRRLATAVRACLRRTPQ